MSESESSPRGSARRARVLALVEQIHGEMSEEDREAIRESDQSLHDESGLPR